MRSRSVLGRQLPRSDARWQLVQRIAASASFRPRIRLRPLLLYLCDRALQNRRQDLSESLIAQRVFCRKLEGNTLRESVRNLRKLLEQYFATEGSHEPVVITIPEGSCVPVFGPRADGIETFSGRGRKTL